jgi:hypothetical protein
MAIGRINTGNDVVNGLATVRPRDNGHVDSTTGNGSTPWAQSIPSGHDPAQWGVLNGRYVVDPTGWSS